MYVRNANLKQIQNQSKSEPSKEVVSIGIFVEDFDVDGCLVSHNKLYVQTSPDRLTRRHFTLLHINCCY